MQTKKCILTATVEDGIIKEEDTLDGTQICNNKYMKYRQWRRACPANQKREYRPIALSYMKYVDEIMSYINIYTYFE